VSVIFCLPQKTHPVGVKTGNVVAYYQVHPTIMTLGTITKFQLFQLAYVLNDR